MNPTNYALDRLQSISFDPSKDFGIYTPNPTDPTIQIKQPRMWPDEAGNLCISIVDLDNNIITKGFTDSKKLRARICHVLRLADPKDSDSKYIGAFTGMGVYPFIWINTIILFQKKAVVKCLVITEGPLKAYELDKHGVAVIGLPGITIWKNRGETAVFELIKDFIIGCQVETIVWLTDADSLTVEWRENKDLWKRANSFFSSVALFKDMLGIYGKAHFWSYVNSKFFKGIDDLLIGSKKTSKQIIAELTQPEIARQNYFARVNAGRLSLDRIREIFGINGRGHEGAKNFYAKYKDEIDIKPFVYSKGVYQWNLDTNTLDYIRSNEAQQFIMVGSTLYMKGPQLIDHGESDINSPIKKNTIVENILIPIKKEEFKKMFQHKSKEDLERVFADIPHYNRFINRPNHLEYIQDIEVNDPDTGFTLRYYNKYNRLSWKPKEGPIDLSLQFIKHIFGENIKTYKGKNYINYELGLDFLQLLYLNPKQKLPIIALVSEHGDTGKTLFFEWIGAIFQSNCREITSEQLTAQFSTYYANCLYVYIDETMIEKTATVERIKSLVTGRKIKLEGKFEHADQIDSYLHIGLTSNNVRSFAHIRNEEMRFWVLEVPQIKPENYDPYFREKLFAEIPFLLNFLLTRELTTSKGPRLWFSEQLTDTDALANIKKESRTHAEIVLEMAVKPYIQGCKEIEILLAPKDIQELINDNKFSAVQIRAAMLRKNIEINKSSNRYTFYEQSFSDMDNEFKLNPVKRKNACYRIRADQFLDPAECVFCFSDLQLIELENLAIKENAKTWFQVFKLNPMRYPLSEDFYKSHNLMEMIKYNSYQEYINFMNEKDKAPF